MTSARQLKAAPGCYNPPAVARLAFLLLAAALLYAPSAWAVTAIDDAGQKHDFTNPPAKVVSLVPSATEIICGLEAGQALAGVTSDDSYLACLKGVPVLGRVFDQAKFSLINDLRPNLVIVSPNDFEAAVAGRGQDNYAILVVDDHLSLARAEAQLKLLGQIFQKESEAAKLIRANEELLATVAQKTAKIPAEKKRSVLGLSFKDANHISPDPAPLLREIIQAAGGQWIAAPNGAPLNLDQWHQLNPQVLVTCGADMAALKDFLNQDGWRDVPAVKDARIYNFPCALTQRAATHTGYVVAWLASLIYDQEFANPAGLVHPQEIISERPVSLDLPYVEKALIVDSRLMDFVHRTLLINFKKSQTVVSSDGGQREGISTVGNSFFPVPTWSLYHLYGYEKSRLDLLKVLQLDEKQAELIFTGADLNNLAVKSETFKDLTVYALATAGVEGNALRTSRDVGGWYEEPGTINIIVLTNHQLSPRAAARALITITEAKTAVLWDMDIRSRQTPLVNPATGTGTDSVIVVSGEGPVLTSSGGHSKLGELIGRTVYEAVEEALLKQNGKFSPRSVFERLEERGLNLSAIIEASPALNTPGFYRELEEVLLKPRYQGFLEMAFSLSDGQIMGQVTNLESFEALALSTASDIAGRPVEAIEELVAPGDLPQPLKLALNSLLTGLKHRSQSDSTTKAN